MALQGSGAISLLDIATEFGGTAPHSLSEYYGKGNAPASGAIRIGNNFYGTSSQFAFTITSNQTNASLSTLATNAGWDGASALVATINSGVYISSNSTGTPALTVSGSYPAGVTLINNGYIIGRGGNGGNGATGNSYVNGGSGSSGGGALSVSSTITITNNGTIGGGGGGGGGGGMRYHLSVTAGCGGGGGGGGRSSAAANSSGGAGGPASGWDVNLPGGAGGSGTVSAAGSGGAGGYYSTYYRGGNGGSGGNWGANGSNGQRGGNGYGTAGGAGGGAGYAVSGNSKITWSATGTRLGAIS